MNKKILIAILVILVIGVVVWFGVTQTKKQKISQEPIKVGVVLYPGFGTPYISQEKGFFTNEGIKVEIVMLPVETMVPALESGQVQLLVGSIDMMPIIADANINAKAILSTSISYGADGIVVKNNINNIKDLKGQKVYLAYGFPGHFLFRFLAERAGLSYSDVELVNLNPDDVGSSFISGSVNAGVTWEPWLSKATERADGKVLLTSREEPGIITDIIMARADLLENRKEDIKRFMRGFFKGVDYWNNNKDEGNTIVAKNFNLTKDEFAPMYDTIKLSNYNFNLEKFDKTKSLNVFELVNKSGEVYLKDGIIKAKPDADKLIDASLLKELY